MFHYNTLDHCIGSKLHATIRCVKCWKQEELSRSVKLLPTWKCSLHKIRMYKTKSKVLPDKTYLCLVNYTLLFWVKILLLDFFGGICNSIKIHFTRNYKFATTFFIFVKRVYLKYLIFMLRWSILTILEKFYYVMILVQITHSAKRNESETISWDTHIASLKAYQIA